MASKIFVHLRSTTAVCMPKMVDIRSQLYSMIDEGKVAAALRRLVFVYFYTPFVDKSERTKKSFLLRIWERIDERNRKRAAHITGSALDLVENATDNEWLQESMGAAKYAKAIAAHELADVRKSAELLGRAGAMIYMMCCTNEGEITERSLRFIADELENMDGA